ncbi:MAG: Gfo/Idh/MocA family oxidoreductase [Candidatus Omnitrophica bacterium]|nr:Gfo/Idh/MocA family oxidoreductase [Candidatus Omnitrophota bacterium]
MRIGILSFAHMHAVSYAECLKNIQFVEIAGIFDSNQKRGKAMAKRFKSGFFPSYQRLLKEDIDGVIICSENSKHRQLVVASAQAGKHILCEKPVATALYDARIMLEVCQRRKVKFQAAFPCRFSPSVIRAKELIDDGAIGDVLAVKATNQGVMPGGWFVQKKESGGGAVMDHAVHVVDLLRWILKKEIKDVFAEIDTRFYRLPVDDCAAVTMELDGGIFATLDPSWSRPARSYPAWGNVSMDFIGTRGVVSMDLFNQKMALYNNDSVRAVWEYWGDNLNAGLVQEFINAIREDRNPSVTGEDGLRALEVTLAAYESAHKKKPVPVKQVNIKR